MNIWITGASSGIGQATAYSFAKRGEKLVLTALEGEDLNNTVKQCLALGAAGAVALPFNLLETDKLPELCEKAWSAFNGLNVVYCNAGISQRTNVADTDMAMVRKIMELNYFCPVIMAKELLPKMLAAGGGQFAVTTSINGRFGFPLRCAYSSSKHALYGFFETLAAEYHDQNIAVTIVCPGRVQTNISFFALEKGGKQHGKLDAGQAGGLTADKAGEKIVRAIYKKKPEVLVGKKELLMVYIKRFFPRLCAYLARKVKPM
ncbi:MAG: SDR family NAD(P)-dependent oxidoreductase [Bacteroidales bacterium]|nr:SDR family NAD(P)-dependent oxidoreductase [Bacteroidales bacterium]